MVCDLVLYALLLAWFDFFEIWKIGVVESVFFGGGVEKGVLLTRISLRTCFQQSL